MTTTVQAPKGRTYNRRLRVAISVREPLVRLTLTDAGGERLTVLTPADARRLGVGLIENAYRAEQKA